MDFLALAQILVVWLGVAALVLLALSSLLTVAEKTGVLDFIPPYRRLREEQEKARIRLLLDTLNDLVLRQEDQRTARLLEGLGISNRQFHRQIRQAVEFVNAMTAKHVDALTTSCWRFAGGSLWTRRNSATVDMSCRIRKSGTMLTSLARR